MSGPMRFPKDPLKGTEGRFSDEHGNNPFAEQDAAAQVDAAAADNVYATSIDEEATNQTPEYETFLMARHATLPLAVVAAIIAIVAAAIQIWAPSTAYVRISVFFIGFAGAALAVSMVVMGYRDLTAMRAGAMDQSAAGKTTLAVVIGGIAATIAVLTAIFCEFLNKDLF